MCPVYRVYESLEFSENWDSSIKKIIIHKIQKENCKIEMNNCLIKCLQDRILCQLVNCISVFVFFINYFECGTWICYYTC